MNLSSPIHELPYDSVDDILSQDYSNIDHRDNDVNFISDVVFTQSIRFLWSIPFPIPQIFGWIVVDVILYTFHIFTRYEIAEVSIKNKKE